MRFHQVAVAGALLAVVLPTTASARRPATRSEKSAIAAGFEKHTTASPLSCYTVFVSTVDRRWASLTFRGLRDGESATEFIDKCPGAADGRAMMRHRGESWVYAVDAGSYADECPVKRVPTRVAVDLRACRSR